MFVFVFVFVFDIHEMGVCSFNCWHSRGSHTILNDKWAFVVEIAPYLFGDCYYTLNHVALLGRPAVGLNLKKALKDHPIFWSTH